MIKVTKNASLTPGAERRTNPDAMILTLFYQMKNGLR
jgi:hypothetical protein